MGDRISISFKNGEAESVSLFHHWGGMSFLDEALEYVNNLTEDITNGNMDNTYPLGRLEPATVMVDFIRFLTKDMKRVNHNLYLGKDKNDGDDSDNGHYIIDLGTKKIL